MSFEFNTDILLQAIQDNVAIWDKSIKMHKDQVERRLAWNEVGKTLFTGFDEFDVKKKNVIVNKLMNKWRSIRDAYIRSLKDSNRNKKRKYLYGSQLSFLHKNMELKTNILEIDEVSYLNTDQEYLNEERSSSNINIQLRTPTQPLEQNVVVKPTQDERDEDMEFFSSLLSSVRKFDEDEKLEFRSEVIQVIQRIRNRRVTQTNYQVEGLDVHDIKIRL